MRRLALAPLLITALLAAACSDDNDPAAVPPGVVQDDADGSATAPGTGDVPVPDVDSPTGDPVGDGSARFSGIRQSDCVPDGETYSTRSFFVDAASGTVQYRLFADAGCSEALLEFGSPFVLRFGELVEIGDGTLAQAVDITFEAPVTVTPATGPAAANLSASGYCGITDFATDVPSDVTGCADTGDVGQRVGTTLATIAAIESFNGTDALYLGDEISLSQDGSEARPTLLDRGTPYLRVMR